MKISLKFVAHGPIDNIPALVQIMAWRRPGDKPLSESMMVSLPTHICVTRPQWAKETVCKFITKYFSQHILFMEKLLFENLWSTLTSQGLDHAGQIGSTSWLLMSWLLTRSSAAIVLTMQIGIGPWHPQGRISIMCTISVREWHINFYFFITI